MTTVYVLLIEHRHGINTSIFLDQQRAHDALAEYVREWWNQEMPKGLSAPESDNEAIQDYFCTVESESYTLDECELQA